MIESEAASSPKRVIRAVRSTPRRRPAVTAVIPAYNYARYLRESVASVLSQRDVDVRVIVIDDCSADETPQIGAELEVDSRITFLRNERNLGHIPSVNRGMELADTEFVVKLDADDLLAPGSLARATALLDEHRHVSFVYGRPRHFSGPVPRAVDRPALSWTIWAGREWIARLCRMGINAISQPEVVIRTSVLAQALPIREDLPHTSDMHLWMQLAAMGDVARVNGPAQGYYREHEASMQRTVNAGAFFDLRCRRDAFDAAFAGIAGGLAGSRDLHDQARRTLAGNSLDRACRAYDRGRTSDAQVEELIAFALDVWPAARQLPEWAALERRRSVGAARAARDPRFMLAALLRRGLEETSRMRWRYTGEVGPTRWQQLGVR